MKRIGYGEHYEFSTLFIINMYYIYMYYVFILLKCFLLRKQYCPLPVTDIRPLVPASHYKVCSVPMIQYSTFENLPHFPCSQSMGLKNHLIVSELSPIDIGQTNLNTRNGYSFYLSAHSQNGIGSMGKSLDDITLTAQNHNNNSLTGFNQNSAAAGSSNCNSSNDLLRLDSEKRNSYHNSRQSSAETAGSIKFNTNCTDIENTALWYQDTYFC